MDITYIHSSLADNTKHAYSCEAALKQYCKVIYK